jgi:hypothetical protein
LDEVLAPDESGVATGRLDRSDGHVFGFEEGDKFAIGRDEVVAGAAGYPEETEVGGLWVEGGKGLFCVKLLDGGAESEDVRELVGVGEADSETLEAAQERPAMARSSRLRETL